MYVLCSKRAVEINQTVHNHNKIVLMTFFSIFSFIFISNLSHKLNCLKYFWNNQDKRSGKWTISYLTGTMIMIHKQ